MLPAAVVMAGKAADPAHADHIRVWIRDDFGDLLHSLLSKPELESPKPVQ